MKGVRITADRLDDVVSNINALLKQDVLVGIPASDGERNAGEPINNAALGYIHENGSPANNIPARPFLVPGVAGASEAIEQKLRKAADAALNGQRRKIGEQLNAAGMVARDAVKSAINSGDFAPLSEATLKARAARGRKGAVAELASRAAGNAPNNSNARPLIDTGQLRNAINYVVRDK